MIAFAEFEPAKLEKILDMLRHIASFANLNFQSDGFITMRLVDPAKVLYAELAFTDMGVYKCEREGSFGVHLPFFYKLVKSLQRDQSVYIEVDGDIMQVTQGHSRYSIQNNQTVKNPAKIDCSGPGDFSAAVPTKVLQRYVRTLGNISPSVRISVDPNADQVLFDAGNSMYQTSMAIKMEGDDGGRILVPATKKYTNQFLYKFVELAINPAVDEYVELQLGSNLCISYDTGSYCLAFAIAPYTEG